MKLSWYGTASVMFESEGYRIVFDPFLTIPIEESLYRRKLHAIKYRTANAVLVTHGHFDHIIDIPKLYRNTDTKVYATKTPCKTLMSRGNVERDQLRVIGPDVTFTLGGFTIRAYQGRHCRYDLGIMLKTVFKWETLTNPKRLYDLIKLNRLYAENGETLFYEIEAEGKRVQVMGSMGLDFSTMYPTGADVLILPFQGTANPAHTVAPIIHRLKPKKIYLDHYDNTFPPLSSHVSTVDFIARLHRHSIPAAPLTVGMTYEI